MKVLSITAPVNAFAACDLFIGGILHKHLAPAVADADCPVARNVGLDKKGHYLQAVCYESSGPTSHINIDAHLNCHGSNESVVGKLFGGRNVPSVSEDVRVEVDVSGANCGVNYVKVKPSGELGKLFAHLFDANGKARKALERGLAEVCKK
jgi:hypothetical protein